MDELTEDEPTSTLEETPTSMELAEAISLDTLDTTAALLCALDDGGEDGGLTEPLPPPQPASNETAVKIDAA